MKTFARRTYWYGWVAFALPLLGFLYYKEGLKYIALAIFFGLACVIGRLLFWWKFRAQDYADSFCPEHEIRKTRDFVVKGTQKVYYSYCEKCYEEQNIA